MKKTIFILFILLLAGTAFCQEKNAWDRLRTDDGEMTVKMPAGCYAHFYNPDGITVSEAGNRNRYRLTEMRLVSCYHERTLMSVEIYETPQARAAARILQKSLKIDGEELNLGEKFYAVEKTVKTDRYFSRQRIVAGKKHVYIITAATRGEPGDALRVFLDSLAFNADASTADKNSVALSALANVLPEVLEKQESDEKQTADPQPGDALKTLEPLIRISIPTAYYSEAARQKRTTGKVVLRLTLNERGRISRLQVVRDLPFGLMREAVLAALRIKFLPAEQNGVPRPTTQLIEYNFGSY